MVPKAKKEAPSPPKAEAMALKAKKAVVKGIHGHTHTKYPHVTHLSMDQDTVASKAA